MKTASLLLAFPLLLPVCTTHAAPRELRADGRYEFRNNGRSTKYVIARDEVYRRNAGSRVLLSARDNLRSTQTTARQLAAETGDRIDMVAYPEGQTPTEQNRRVVARSVTLKLAEGVDPLVVALAANATSFRYLAYAKNEYVLQFPDNQAALSAAQDLKGIPGVSEVSVELARRYYPQALPTFNDPQLTFATTNVGGGQQIPIFYDFYNQKTMEPAVFQDTNSWAIISRDRVKPYQWYLFNSGVQMDQSNYQPLFPPFEERTVDGVPLPLPPPSIYTPDNVPPFAVPNDLSTYNPFFDILADINVTGAWSQTVADGTALNGAGVRVAVMDDGIQVSHEDLTGASLFDKNSSYNFLNKEGTFRPQDAAHYDPTPVGFNATAKPPNHGTAMAGLIFGRANNGKGGVGVAYGATMIGYRFLGPFLEPSVVADMLVWGAKVPATENPDKPRTGDEWRFDQPKFDVAVNAYGEGSTSGNTLADSDRFFKKALAYGATAGRNGKGVVYVFPAGNNGEDHGNSNYSYTSSSRYSIHVGSISDMGRRVIYSSPGASVHVVAPSGGGEMAPAIVRDTKVFPAFPLVVPSTNVDRSLGYTVSPDDYDGIRASNTYARTRNTQLIVTTDSGAGGAPISAYNKDFNGTSASAALVTGVVALMLQANPELGWRDVQEILMRSARVVDPLYGEWAFNPLGMPMSHKYGAGLVDAAHAVAMAKVWKNLGPPAGQRRDNEWSGEERQPTRGRTINRLDTNKVGTEVSFSSPAGSMRIEHVVVKVQITHTRPGDLGIILTAPQTGQADAPVESYLFIPHREYVTDDIVGNVDVVDENPDDTQVPDHYYEFTTVRHWGTAVDNPSLKPDTGAGTTGTWLLKIWDNTKYGKTGVPSTPPVPVADPNSTKLEDGVYVDRVIVPEGDNTVDGVLNYAAVAFHGTASPSENLAPTIVPDSIVARPGRPIYYRVKALTDSSSLGDLNQPRAPMLGYHFRVLGPVSGTATKLFTSPNNFQGFLNAYPDPAEGEPELEDFPSFRFGLKDGILTNVLTPNVTPSVTWRSVTGINKELTLNVQGFADVAGLVPGMYVVGRGVAPRARIAENGINAETNTITLTAANVGNVDDVVRFTNQGPSTGQKGEYTVKVEDPTGLVPGMYVSGANIGVGAQIAHNGVNVQTKTVTLTVPNIETVNEVIFFTDLEDFAFPGTTGSATGKKNERTVVMADLVGAFEGAYISGAGIGDAAQVTKIDVETKTLTLSVPNKENVSGEVQFNFRRMFNTLVKGRWNVEVSGTNIFGTTRKQMTFEVRDDVKYEDWVNTFNPPITEPDGDPDGDGANNIIEFVSGGEPFVRNTYEMPSSSIVDGKLVFRYQVDKNALGAVVTPQLSTDLSDWKDTAAVKAETVNNLTYYTVTLELGDARKFFRLKAKA
ncbi:MAG: S8 family serine peptidase [Verrucomicrobiota bacterium]